MYKGYEKVKKFIGQASNLLDTSRCMKDIFESIVTRNEKAICCIYLDNKGKARKYKYRQFKENSYAYGAYISNALKDLDKNTPIVIKVANGPHWGELFYGILMSGHKPLLIDAKANKEGAANLIKQSKAVAIITDDSNDYEVSKLSSFDIIEKATLNDSFKPEWENEVYFCSSGTTGDAKLMVYKGENLINQINAALNMSEETGEIVYPKSNGKLRILAMLPFHHIFGFVAVFLWYTFYGKTLVYIPSNTPSDIQMMCQKYGVTHVYSVPLLWDGLVQGLLRKAALEGEKKQELVNKMIAYNTGKISSKEAGLAGTDIAKKTVQKKLLGPKIRYCISGGGYLSSRTLEVINGIGYPLYNGFGMTEVGVTSVCLDSKVEGRLQGNIGHPLHQVEYKIAGEGNKGELLIKSPITHVREIIGGVEKETVLDDGYYHSGDIAEVDENGNYYIRGRMKDIIINSTGENIFPDELEMYFKGLPHSTQLSVLGVAKEGTTDEDIVLVLELDNQVGEEEIKNIENIVKETKLPHDVKIANIYLAKGKIPLSASMKVKRFAIKKAIENNTGEYILINAKKETKSLDGIDPKQAEELTAKVREIFSKILFLPVFKIEDNGHWINDLGGDSMSYVELILTVQDTFQVKIPEEQYGLLTCVNDFVYIIAQLLKDNKAE